MEFSIEIIKSPIIIDNLKVQNIENSKIIIKIISDF